MTSGCKFFHILIIAGISGCGSVTDLSKREGGLLEASGNKTVVKSAPESLSSVEEFDDLLKYASSLSEVYFKMGDSALIQQEVTSSGILAAAAGGAGVLLFGGGKTALEAIGLGGGVLVAADSYIDPVAKADALYSASGQAGCLAVRSSAFKPDTNNPGEASAKKAVLVAALNTIRINLRKTLRRETPGFEGQISAYVAGVNDLRADEQELVELTTEINATLKQRKQDRLEEQMRVNELKVAVNACLLPEALANLLKVSGS